MFFYNETQEMHIWFEQVLPRWAWKGILKAGTCQKYVFIKIISNINLK